MNPFDQSFEGLTGPDSFIDDRRYAIICNDRPVGGLLSSLADAETTALEHVRIGNVHIHRVGVLDSFGTVRGWRAITTDPYALHAPWIAVSPRAAQALQQQVDATFRIPNSGSVCITRDGNLYAPRRDRTSPDFKRPLGTVDDYLRAFIERWNTTVRNSAGS